MTQTTVFSSGSIDTFDLHTEVSLLSEQLADLRSSWIIGINNNQIDTFVSTLRDKDCIHCWDVETPPERMLETYSGIQSLIAQFLPVVYTEQPELIHQYQHVLESVCPQLIGQMNDPPSPLSAHAVAFAIVRRISRESLYTASLIDGTARFIIDVQRQCPSLSQPWHIVFRRFDLLDRPSLRILYRLLWLLDPNDTIRLTGACVGNPLAETPVPVEGVCRSRLATARLRLFQRLAEGLSTTVVGNHLVQNQALPEPFEAIPSGYDFTLRIAENLVEQNYDRAYLLAEYGLCTITDAELKADIYRLVGLVDANIGEYEVARYAIEQAISLTSTPTLLAHLHYLVGLLLTKRTYDLDSADAYYTRGLALLEEAPTDDSQAIFERAWLINGRALVTSLRAKSLAPEEQTVVLEQVLRDEIAAFRMAGKGKAPHLVYLRHNLLANIAFVLEILKRYPEAITFWTRAFGQYLEQGTSAQRFEPVYLYRIGLLEWKQGQSDVAISSLQRARQGAQNISDRFLEERILYGLGYIAFDSHNWDEANNAFYDGLMQAYELRDWQACIAQGIGAWRAAMRKGDVLRATEVHRRLVNAPDPSVVEAAAHLETLPFHRPSPKLPAYLPGIDLEPSPEMNLNVYLVSEGKGLLKPKGVDDQ